MRLWQGGGGREEKEEKAKREERVEKRFCTGKALIVPGGKCASCSVFCMGRFLFTAAKTLYI
jgi:hypothetical protein